MKTETQLNAEIDSEICTTHKKASRIADSTIEKTTEAALRFFYGSKDREVIELRARAIEAARILTKGKRYPFNQPLTPFISNVQVG